MLIKRLHNDIIHKDDIVYKNWFSFLVESTDFSEEDFALKNEMLSWLEANTKNSYTALYYMYDLQRQDLYQVPQTEGVIESRDYSMVIRFRAKKDATVFFMVWGNQ